MKPDNTDAYTSLKKANDAMRDALKIAADSPIPADTWNDYGRVMDLQGRAMAAIKPKGA